MKAYRLISLVLVLGVCLTLCSCSFPDITVLAGKTVDYSDTLYGDSLDDCIVEKKDSITLNVLTLHGGADLETVKKDAEAYIKKDVLASYYIESVKYTLEEHGIYNAITMTPVFRKNTVPFDRLIDTRTITVRQAISRAEKEMNSDGMPLRIAFVLNSVKTVDKDAKLLLNSIVLSSGTPYYIRKTNCQLFTTENGTVMQVNLICNIDENTRRTLKTQLDSAVNRAAAQIGKLVNAESTKRDICQYIHDYVVGCAEYDETISDEENISKAAVIGRTAYGALVNRKTICSGYAEAFRLIYNAVVDDGECITIGGNVGKEDTGHAWNAVRDGKTVYYIDCTADDTNSNYDKFYIPADNEAYADYVAHEDISIDFD